MIDRFRCYFLSLSCDSAYFFALPQLQGSVDSGGSLFFTVFLVFDLDFKFIRRNGI